MKRWTLYSILALICCCSGCLYTLNPLFKPGDLEFDSRLLGTWKDKENKMIIDPAKADDLIGFPKALQDLQSKTYTLQYFDKNDHVEYKYLCFLLRLGQEHYMDLYPLKNSNFPSTIKAMSIPGHKFFKIKIQDKRVEINDMKDEFLSDQIKQKKLNIPHLTRTDGTVLITASTEELQQYVLKYANVAEAFEETPNIWNK